MNWRPIGYRNMTNIILASQSPRRRELLSLAGYKFDIITSTVEEVITKSVPGEVVEELSFQKARDVFNSQAEKDVLVIGADTVVSIDGNILGKPANEKHAFEMLRKLQGRTHEVYTGVSLVWKNGSTSFNECTRVTFYPMTEEEIWDYIRTNDPMDKAGAYGIQSGAAKYIQRIDGDYYNVVGLPIARLYHEINKISERA